MSSGGRWFRVNTTWSQSEWLAALSPASRLAWIELLGYVKAHGAEGRVRAVAPVVFGRMFGIGADDVRALLTAAEADGALTIEDGEWVLTGWTTHQGDPTAKDRMKRYRQRKGVTDVTRNQRSVTPTETETETEVTDTEAKASAAEPPREEPGPDPAPAHPAPPAALDPEAERRSLHARVAPLIRTHLWRGRQPPPGMIEGRPITMERELTAAQQLAAKYSLDELCGAIECARDALPQAGERPISLLHFNRSDKQQFFHLAVEQWRSRETDAAGAQVDHLLSGIGAGGEEARDAA